VHAAGCLRVQRSKRKSDVASLAGANLAELQHLVALLPLLRSGWLTGLLVAGQRKETVPAASDSGRKRVKTPVTSATAVEPTAERAASEMLVGVGFSCEGHSSAVHVAESAAQFKVDVPSVCLATQRTALQAKAELCVRVPMAILSPAPVTAESEVVHVLLKDKNGKEHVQRRFFCQLGSKAGRYMHDAPKCTAVNVHTEKNVVFGVVKETSPAWDAALTAPRKVLGNWPPEVGKIACIICVKRPSLQDEGLQAVVVLREGSRDQCLKESGQNGIFVRTFAHREQANSLPREHCTVPVPCSQDLKSALRTANSLKGH